MAAFCRNGHPRTAANTRMKPEGSKIYPACRACHRENEKAGYRRRAETGELRDRRAYLLAYYRKNRKKMNAKQRVWNRENMARILALRKLDRLLKRENPTQKQVELMARIRAQYPAKRGQAIISPLTKLVHTDTESVRAAERQIWNIA